ncbi:hypothetical protein [Streptomyces sp. Rer75]|uniref:hypothetical protein n=1 Tax=unclassified Streptomyces TaxID=2593676 RepID=UPI0015D048F8|nr:hypothetical protein [Streptomyces sp. Rer75]QLH23550.1 hypothetical protein HYQ63_25420 [Streptomyces sp. Rer75]
MQRRSLRLFAVTLVGVLALTGSLTGCGKKKSSGLGGSDSGFVSGGTGGGDEPASGPSGLSSDIPTDLPSGASDLPSYGSPTTSDPYSSSAPSTYNPDATSETSGTNCRYDQSTSQFKYDVTVTNTDATRSFRYSVSTKWNEYGSDGLLGYDSQDVTVLPGQSETFTAAASYTITKRTQYTCQISLASKTPASS